MVQGIIHEINLQKKQIANIIELSTSPNLNNSPSKKNKGLTYSNYVSHTTYNKNEEDAESKSIVSDEVNRTSNLRIIISP